MDIRIGYEIEYYCFQPMPMMLMLHVHESRQSDLLNPDTMAIYPPVPISTYIDGFGNRCTRIMAPPGPIKITTDTVVRDSGLPDPQYPHLGQVAVEELPDDVLVYLLGSRYCETDHLSPIAWNLFGSTPPGWARVQAVVDWVHSHIQFGYHHARKTRTAWEAYNERQGVCRDFTHLAVALCRCLNIPARYCTGYLGDIGVRASPDPMDFSAWFEAYLDGQWYSFDARNRIPRIGRILIGRGRDATDVAISNTFGSNNLTGFKVWTDEIVMAG